MEAGSRVDAWVCRVRKCLGLSRVLNAWACRVLNTWVCRVLNAWVCRVLNTWVCRVC